MHDALQAIQGLPEQQDTVRQATLLAGRRFDARIRIARASAIPFVGRPFSRAGMAGFCYIWKGVSLWVCPKSIAMKKFFLLVAAGFLFLPLGALDASLSYATFRAPNQNYIEIYLHLLGNTITFNTAEEDRMQAQVEVIILFKQDEQIVKADKYLLSSPLSEQPVDLIDLKRYALANGNYTLEVVLTDQNRPENQKSYSTQVVMDYDAEGLQLSDVQLLAQVSRSTEQHPLVKNGLLMEPLPFNFYSRSASRLTFYTEVYNLQAELDASRRCRQLRLPRNRTAISRASTWPLGRPERTSVMPWIPGRRQGSSSQRGKSAIPTTRVGRS